MKIRTWLMVTYLVVMLLPLAAVYGFFLLVEEWDQSRRLADNFELTEQIRSIEDGLQDTSLYQVQALDSLEEKLPAEAVRDEAVTIELYRSDGVRVYHSSGEQNYFQQMNRSRLLKDLYQYDLSYQTVSVKKPVFEDQQIQGVYKISIDRSDWVAGVESRRTMMLTAIILLFGVIYTVVLWLLQRKLTRPLNQLMSGMTHFASEQETVIFERKKNDEIGRLMTHFEQMQHQIEAAQKEAKREQEEKQLMMASFSHDIKTPLTSLQAYAEALQNEKLLTVDERGEYLEILSSKSRHLKGLIEDLTTYSKLQSAHFDMPRSEVDAEEFFEMLLEGYDELARNQCVFLQKQLVIEGSCLMNDRHMVRYVDNLMSNALRYTPEGKTIGVAAVGARQPLPSWVFPEVVGELNQKLEERAAILVQNEGPTIEEEHIHSVFTPFYQGERARTSDEAKHSGLGLSIALMIAEKHEGEMNLWSVPGKGTVIAMFFSQINE